MACDAATIKQRACTSGIGRLTKKTHILQVLAQNLCSASLAPPDPYDGLLVYTRQGLGDTTVVNPAGAFNLTFGANKVTEIHCHNCPLITGITCDSNFLTVVDLEDLPAIANLNFSGSTALTSVNLDTFTSISGSLNLLNCTSLASFSASSLTSVGVNFFLTGAIIPSLSLPSLLSVGALSCGEMPTFTSVSLPLLQTSTSYLYFNSTSLVTISLPSLQNAAILYLENMPATLTSISLPALESAATILIGGNSSLLSISVPLLQSCSEILANDNILLTSFSAPSYNAALPFIGFNFNSCSSLVSVSFLAFNSNDGSTYHLSGCALDQTTVDNFIQALANGANFASELYLDGGTSSPPDAARIALAIQLNIDGNIVTHN